MKSNLVSHEENKATFTIEIPYDEFTKAQEEIYKENKQYFQVPGFRKGHAPMQMVKMHFGKEVFYEDAINDLIQEFYGDALDELELEPVSQPNIDLDFEDIKKDEPIVLTIEVDTLPEAKLGDTSKLEAEIPKMEVSDDDIDQVLNRELEENARIVQIDDRPVKDGDLVNINFEGFVDGEAFEGGTAEGYDLTIGSGQFIPGFEDQIIGKEIDEEFNVEVTFPEDYNQESLQGQDAVFKTTVNEITEKVLPELDDEFVKDISEFDTLDEYKESLRERLEKELNVQKEEVKNQAAIEALAEVAEVEIPDSMIDMQIERELDQMRFQLQNMGLPFEQYLEMMGESEASFKVQMKPTAKANILQDLALTAFTEAQDYDITDDEKNEFLDKLVESYPEDQKEDMTERLLEQEDMLLEDIKRKKALEDLVESVTFVEVEETEEEESEEE